MSKTVIVVDDEPMLPVVIAERARPMEEVHEFKNYGHSSAALLAMLALGGMPRVHVPAPPPIKRCVQCGKAFRHNNAFCSADCCRAYRTTIPQKGKRG